MLAALDSREGRFFGAGDEGGELVGAALADGDGLAYLNTQNPQAATALGKILRDQGIDVLLAERETADRAWRAMSRSSPRLILDQSLYVLEQVPSIETLPLRPARSKELAVVQRIAQSMFWEEVGLPPSIPTLNAHIAEEVEEGSIRVFSEEGKLLFLARVAISCKEGAELQRVYTAPSRRREGIATRGIATLCKELLETLPRVVLRVNESNQAAIRLYRKIGFRRAGRIRLFCR